MNPATIDRLVHRLRRAFKWVARRWCALRGHDDMLQFAAGRMYLRCATCGRESSGWQFARPLRHAPPAALTGPHASVARFRSAA
jgi:hypothetical protein